MKDKAAREGQQPEFLADWVRLLEADQNAGLRALDRLAKSNHSAFVATCHDLLAVDSIVVRKAALRMLRSFGERQDSIALAAAHAALSEPELRGEPEVAKQLLKGAIGQSRNRYEYVVCNPETATDPTGHIGHCYDPSNCNGSTSAEADPHSWEDLGRT